MIAVVACSEGRLKMPCLSLIRPVSGVLVSIQPAKLTVVLTAEKYMLDVCESVDAVKCIRQSHRSR